MNEQDGFLIKTRPAEAQSSAKGATLNDGLGWTVTHPKYGKWFISRDAIIVDWKQDRAQAYPEDPAREPTDEEVETWWNEQTSWIEVAACGKQLERPDMTAHEAAWLRQMANDPDYAAIA